MKKGRETWLKRKRKKKKSRKNWKDTGTALLWTGKTLKSIPGKHQNPVIPPRIEFFSADYRHSGQGVTISLIYQTDGA